MNQPPPPPIAAEVDLTDFQFMPLDVRRVRDSRFAAIAEPEAFRAGLLLWCAAWHQIPAGSLPNDDVELAQLAGYGRVVHEWKRVKEGALYGWMLCSDNRLYHEVVVEKAKEAWQSKLERFWRTECSRIKKANQRNKTDEPLPTFEDWLVHRAPFSVPRDKPHMSPGTKKDILEVDEFSTGLSTEKSHGLDVHKDKRGTKTNVPSDNKECPRRQAVMSQETTGVVPRENASKGQGKGQGQGYISKNPPNPPNGGNGSLTRPGRKPRDIRAISSQAWESAKEAIGRSYLRAVREKADPLLGEAIRRLGGWSRLGQSTESENAARRAQFREYYEQALEDQRKQTETTERGVA